MNTQNNSDTNPQNQKPNTFNLKFNDQSKNYYQNQIVEYVPIDFLTPLPNQPRKNFAKESLEELAQSIRTYGILQPLIVAIGSEEKVYIIAGERRWRAARLAELESVPCIVREVNKHNQLEIALIENIQREELSPVEEAKTLQQLIEDHDYTHESLALRIGKSRSTITNALRILTLPEKIVTDLDQKVITSGHARALCSLENKKLQLKTHQSIINRKLSVRQTEEMVKNIRHEKSPSKLSDNISPDLRYVCDLFKGHLGTKVKITGDKDKGSIEINYYTADDLERLSDLILGASEFNRK